MQLKQLQIFQNSNFQAKKMSLNLALKLRYLGVLGSNFKKFLLYLKSTISNLFKCHVSRETKKLEI